jgi:hypothetical protein
MDVDSICRDQCSLGRCYCRYDQRHDTLEKKITKNRPRPCCGARLNWWKYIVRTKIEVDNQDGCVNFQKVQITPKSLRDGIRRIDKLIDKIYGYKETAFDF